MTWCHLTASPRGCQLTSYQLLLRGLEINRVNQVWATDITSYPWLGVSSTWWLSWTGYSRYVLAYRLSNTLEVDFCVAALEEALSKGRPQIFNTDQGSQFTSEAFTSMLLAQGVHVSMDGRGRCMDNVFVERLWRSIKRGGVPVTSHTEMGLRPERGLGLIWPSTTKSGPIKPWAIGHWVRCSM